MKSLDLSGRYESSYARRSRMISLLAENLGRVSPAKTMEFLRDHKNGPSQNSICRHQNGEQFAASVGSIVVQPERRRMWVCKGNPCQNEYVEYTL